MYVTVDSERLCDSGPDVNSAAGVGRQSPHRRSEKYLIMDT